HDVVTIRCPLGCLIMVCISLRDLRGIFLVYRKPPDIFTPAAIGNEKDSLAVRAEFRMAVKGEALGELDRLAAGNGHRENIAQEIERNRFPIRANIKGHP